MPQEIYEQRMKQLKQWLDEGHITGTELIAHMSIAIEELFINTFNQTMEQNNESQL